MKVLLTFLTYGPYHFARLTAAQIHGTGSGMEVIGLSMSAHQSEYAWNGSSHESPLCASPQIPLEQVSANHWRSLLTPILDQVSPDVCAIAGYSHPSMLTLISLCRERGIPWVLMSDSQEKDEVRRSWQEWVKSRLVRLASSGLAAGRPHVEYLATLGLPSKLCSTGYDVVDNAYFAREAAKWKEQFSDQSGTRNHERGTNHVRPYFLASNRFIPKKNLFRLLDAYARYAKSSPEFPTNDKEPSEARQTEQSEATQSQLKPRTIDPNPWPLCLLGDGELKSELLAHAAKLELTIIERAPWEENGNFQTANSETGEFNFTDHGTEIDLDSETKHEERSTKNRLAEKPTVFLPGFRQIDELPRFYAHAGAFVHASTTEQWGLVVNEAMASGLPVIVSNRCGCAPDLVDEGKNGFTFDPSQVDEITTLMERVASLPDAERTALGEAGRGIISDWGPERFAGGLHEAAERAIATGPKRESWVDGLLLKLLIRR